MGADLLDVERATDHGLESVVADTRFGDVKLLVAQVPDARRETQAQKVLQHKDMIGKAAEGVVPILESSS